MNYDEMTDKIALTRLVEDTDQAGEPNPIESIEWMLKWWETEADKLSPNDIVEHMCHIILPTMRAASRWKPNQILESVGASIRIVRDMRVGNICCDSQLGRDLLTALSAQLHQLKMNIRMGEPDEK